MKTCPCGSGADLDACCNRYISGKEKAPTAEALMRARYTSYTLGKIDFIEKTQTDEARKDFDRAASEKWSKDSQWLGLRVLATERGGENDAKGVVSFVAAFAQEGKEYHHEEMAQFRKENGAWLFVDGKTPNRETFVKTGPDVGRNDPCHCGSGKKFKKCHGK